MRLVDTPWGTGRLKEWWRMRKTYVDKGGFTGPGHTHDNQDYWCCLTDLEVWGTSLSLRFLVDFHFVVGSGGCSFLLDHFCKYSL